MPVTAEQAYEGIKAMNAVEVAPLPKFMLSDKVVNIFNVSSRHWRISQGNFGQYFIPACEDGKPYSRACPVKERLTEVVHEDVGRSRYQTWDGRDVAHDIIGANKRGGQGDAYMADSDLTRWGVFIAAGDVPTEEELAAANAQWKKKMIELVEDADAYFHQGPNQYINIDKMHRDACTRLKLSRPWNEEIKEQLLCPGCGDTVNPAAAVHAGQYGCGAVINAEKVIAIKLKGYEYLWQTPAAEAKSEVTVEKATCTHVKADGTECKGTRMQGQNYCVFHQPKPAKK